MAIFLHNLFPCPIWFTSWSGALHLIFTGSIACSASRRYLVYSEADFEVFHPAGATHCTDAGEIWHGGGDRKCPRLCQISPHRCNNNGVGPQKLKFLLRFDQNVEYKRPAEAYPLCDFHKICRVCTSFQDALGVKILLDLLKGLCSYGGFKLRGLVTPKFSAPPSGETMPQTPKVLEVQECARGPLSPRQVWWGSDFTRRRSGQKRSVFFCLFVCLSVRHAFKRQSLCAQFRHEGVGVQKRF